MLSRGLGRYSCEGGGLGNGIGVYQHYGKSYLQRYVSEFDFRYNGRKLNDDERRDEALKRY